MFTYTQKTDAQDAKRQFARILEATGCRTQMELATLLGIRQSSVSEVLKRGKIPPRWLVKLQRLGVNIDWILAGRGPQYTGTPETQTTGGDPSMGVLALRDADLSILHNILRCFPSQDLVAELNRRNIDYTEKDS